MLNLNWTYQDLAKDFEFLRRSLDMVFEDALGYKYAQFKLAISRLAKDLGFL